MSAGLRLCIESSAAKSINSKQFLNSVQAECSRLNRSMLRGCMRVFRYSRLEGSAVSYLLTVKKAGAKPTDHRTNFFAKAIVNYNSGGHRLCTLQYHSVMLLEILHRQGPVAGH
jgi:hypothetical protein